MSGHLRKLSNSTKLEQCYSSVSAGELKTNCLREVREKQRFLLGIAMQERNRENILFCYSSAEFRFPNFRH